MLAAVWSPGQLRSMALGINGGFRCRSRIHEEKLVAFDFDVITAILTKMSTRFED